MTKNQAETLVERLKNACNFHRFDEPGVYVEYVRALARFDYDRMEQAIDEIIEEDSRNVPPISVLIKKYKGVAGTKGGRLEVKNEQYCAVCDDKGFLILEELMKIGEDNEGNPVTMKYQFVYHCPYCAVGSQCKKRSDYRVPAITEVLPDEAINDIYRKNLKKKQQNNNEIKARSLRDITLAVGKDVPEAKYFDEFIPGDAYEGDIDPDIDPEDMPF